jgi:predicted nucleic acid-binding protein
VSYLIDTNIVSELRKGDSCDPNLAAWWASVAEDELFLSPLVLGEIRKGVELARPRDPAKAEALERWLGEVIAAFADRLFPVDAAVAEEWGRMSALRPVPVVDALLAATAKINNLTLVTRNESDVASLGAAVLNPFERE